MERQVCTAEKILGSRAKWAANDRGRRSSWRGKKGGGLKGELDESCSWPSHHLDEAIKQVGINCNNSMVD
jgi:hypothetical protein